MGMFSPKKNNNLLVPDVLRVSKDEYLRFIDKADEYYNHYDEYRVVEPPKNDIVFEFEIARVIYNVLNFDLEHLHLSYKPEGQAFRAHNTLVAMFEYLDEQAKLDMIKDYLKNTSAPLERHAWVYVDIIKRLENLSNVDELRQAIKNSDVKELEIIEGK